MAEKSGGGTLQAIIVGLLLAGSAPWWLTFAISYLGGKPAGHERHSSRGPWTALPASPPATSPGVTPASTPPVAATPIPAPKMGALMLNTNLAGHDLSGSGIERGDAGICEADCRANDACFGVTFVAHPDKPGGMCWQKSSGAATEPRANMVSAYKIL